MNTSRLELTRLPPSGYYAWRHRPLSARARADVELTAKIQVIHRESRGTYGAPRIHAELIADDVLSGRKAASRSHKGAYVLRMWHREAEVAFFALRPDDMPLHRPL